MRLALFDLDNTLLAGDSDHSWGEWLCQRGLVDAAEYQARNDAFYADYVAGKLDVLAYQAFAGDPRSHRDGPAGNLAPPVHAGSDRPIVLAKGEALLAEHRAAGDRLVIITATNRFVTGPIAERLGVETLIATECEMRDGRYTGQQTFDVPCFQGGKVVRLQRWLDENAWTWKAPASQRLAERSAAAGKVSRPVAVDPDPRLRAEAEKRGWPIISLR